jgi:hypothetical protein
MANGQHYCHDQPSQYLRLMLFIYSDFYDFLFHRNDILFLFIVLDIFIIFNLQVCHKVIMSHMDLIH